MKATIAAAIALALLATASPRAQTQPVGDVAFANSGAASAQPAFLYGLAQLHNFEYDDAARAFREAQQIDPQFAMAYWGEAMTKNHPVWMEQDLGGARRILERLGTSSAGRVAKGGTPREQAYLTAAEALYGPGDKVARDLAYLEEMRRLHAAYPDDVDGAAFYALALLGSAHGGRDVAIYMRAAAILEETFASHPDHPGLAHYLIHSYDDPTHAPLGLRAARRYSAIASAAPHALHMTSHIYLAAGMWDDVVAANEQATGVAAARARAAGRNPGGCGHANMWLMYGYLQQGRHKEARRVLDSCRSSATGANGLLLRAPEQDPLDPDNIPAASYIQMWSRYLIDTGDWSSDVAGEDIPLGSLAGATLTRAFVRALAAAARANVSELRGAAAAARTARDGLERALADRRNDADQYRRRAGVIDQMVQAMLDAAERRPSDAIAALDKAAAAEAEMPVEFGPPFVDKPARELLGDVLLSQNRAREAMHAYELALQQTPGRTAALLGAARAAAKMGETAAAQDRYAALRQIWRHADRVPAEVAAQPGR
jgi:tetratricopeptide (TPR) repeat protein